jgi:hypothetical protein
MKTENLLLLGLGGYFLLKKTKDILPSLPTISVPSLPSLPTVPFTSIPMLPALPFIPSVSSVSSILQNLLQPSSTMSSETYISPSLLAAPIELPPAFSLFPLFPSISPATYSSPATKDPNRFQFSIRGMMA